MNSFYKTNKTFITYSLILLILIPIFGLNFFISFIGNILLLIFLVPLLLLLVIFISFNALKSKVRTCNKCGTISLGFGNTCMNCGADLGHTNIKENQIINNPSERTIEIKAEEIK